MKATIYYNMLGHPGESAFARKMWKATHVEGQKVQITDTQFKKHWKKLPIKERVSKDIKKREEVLEVLFSKYNMYATNPYSNENDPGQKTLKRLKVRHTTMMIGDVIEIDNSYYIVTTDGFLKEEIN